MHPKLLLVGRLDTLLAVRMPKEFALAGFSVATLTSANALLSASEFINCRFEWSEAAGKSNTEHKLLLEELLDVIGDWQPGWIIPGDPLAADFLAYCQNHCLNTSEHSALMLHSALRNGFSIPHELHTPSDRALIFKLLARKNIPTTQLFPIKSAIDIYDFIEKSGLPTLITKSVGDGELLISSGSDLAKINPFIRTGMPGPIYCMKMGESRYITTAIAHDGKLLASFSVKEETHASLTHDPVTVSLDESVCFDDLALRVIAALRYSGLLNIKSTRTGENPPNITDVFLHPIRTSHLAAHWGMKLTYALHSQQEIQVAKDIKAKTPITLFPYAWQESPSSMMNHPLIADIPWDEPALLRKIVIRMCD